MPVPSVLPLDLEEELAGLPGSHVVDSFRCEDYVTCERLIGYVVELPLGADREVWAQRLRAISYAADLTRAGHVVVYFGD